MSACIGTKFSSRWGPHMVDLAVDSVTKVGAGQVAAVTRGVDQHSACLPLTR